MYYIYIIYIYIYVLYIKTNVYKLCKVDILYAKCIIVHTIVYNSNVMISTSMMYHSFILRYDSLTIISGFSHLRICRPSPSLSFDPVFMDDAQYAE